MAPATLIDVLERAARSSEFGARFLDRAEREERLTWPTIAARAHATAGALGAVGVEPGDRVALVYPTCPAFLDAFFGTLLAGAVPVPLYPPVRLGRLAEYQVRTARMLRAARVRLVLAEARIRRLIGEAVAAAGPALGCRRLEDLPRGPLTAGRAAVVAPSDLALVQFSSGTTVDPKPVALSHRAVIAQLAVLDQLWPDTPTLRHSGFSWLPLYHDMGLVGCLLSALYRPGELTLLGPDAFVARPALWLRGISRARASISPAPNFAYALCLEKVRDEELAGVDLSCWRIALNGAEAVAPGALREFAARFARWGFRAEALTPVYGLSEACLAVTFSDLRRPFASVRVEREALASGEARPDPSGIELVSVGRPLPGFTLSIRGERGEVLAAGRVGRIWASGPSLMDGYLGHPRATAGALRDGWLDTGDLGFLRGEELFLTGRAKDTVILRGRNYGPDAIEQALRGLPALRPGCAAAVGYLPEDGVREILVLLVEHARDATAAAIRALPDACRQAVLAATGLAPDDVVVLAPGTLPRTSSGKIRRSEALGLHRAGRLAPPRPVTLVTMAGALARSQIAFARARRRAPRGGSAAGGGDER